VRRLREAGSTIAHRVKAIVIVEVHQARPVVSPVYDDGAATEADVVRAFLARFAELQPSAAAPARLVEYGLEELRFSATAALFEGGPRAGAGISVFVARTPPGRTVELHVHPYPETFLLLEGHGRWTAGETVTELVPERMLVVPPQTPHGFRNIGNVPLLVVSVHESAVLQQTFLGVEPA
jgi:mannose-6-phosphate isomerase-like protein (cupin superfamily)